MMTTKQQWFLEKLIKQLQEIDSEKYDINWLMNNTFYYSNGLSIYENTKREASDDIQLCLNELELYK